VVGGAVAPLLINHASDDPRFKQHPGLHIYGIESYIAVPLNRRDGSYFGTLCALDPLPATLSEDDFTIFHLLAQLIGFELEADEKQHLREAELRGLEDLIAIAGHDLRQPLTVLQGRIQLLARRINKGAGTEVVLVGLDELQQQTTRALLLSDMLLDVARMQAGGFSLDYTDFDLVALIQQVLDDSRAIAPSHRFILDAPGICRIQADERRLLLVLSNLLTNATKYAPAASGPITVYLSATPEVCTITVSDSGIGVPDAALTHLFERHYRASNAVERGLSGSGLGLYSAKQVITAHAGSIEAAHSPTSGLAITVTLPLAAQATAHPATQ